jgi:hypothetical protein
MSTTPYAHRTREELEQLKDEANRRLIGLQDKIAGQGYQSTLAQEMSLVNIQEEICRIDHAIVMEHGLEDVLNIGG